MPKIQNIRKQGYLLSITHQNERIIKNLLESIDDSYFNNQERALDLLLSIAFKSKSTFLVRKEDEYKVSKSSIDDDIRRLREILEAYDVSIISVPKMGLQFKGLEKIFELLFLLS
ncbi:helix-turn-helix domain-containing protein [Eremococcus coleocola]|uniref:helix-turn-helix domain-containing protein n=1 Tax=Eremococcus coleocola TaxID=88132 RepID=UPI000481AA8D|nr:helix-turn-helix domain-containing protein [Eremococcus coleocola]